MKGRSIFAAVCAAQMFFSYAVAEAADAVVLKFSHTDQQQGLRHAAAQKFGDKVAEYTSGRYKVQVFPAGQLGNDPKAIEQLALGGVDFTVSSTGSYAPHVDSLNMTMLPYLVESYEQGWKLYDESKWLQAQFDDGGADRSRQPLRAAVGRSGLRLGAKITVREIRRGDVAVGALRFMFGARLRTPAMDSVAA